MKCIGCKQFRGCWQCKSGEACKEHGCDNCGAPFDKPDIAPTSQPGAPVDPDERQSMMMLVFPYNVGA